MSQNSRIHNERGRREDERNMNDGRRQNAAHPERSSGEQDMERSNHDNENRDRRAWLLSSIDYDLNAE
ncbi:MAG TPA: hypothetical protein VGD17_03060 [Chitinophagaceae bacterium]